MITYITEVSIGWFLFYTYYHFVLKKLTYFNFNRWYLLGSFVLSLLLPLVPPLWGISEPEPGISDRIYMELLLASLAQFDETSTVISEPVRRINWLIVIYWIGAGLMSLRFLYGLGKIAVYYFLGQRVKRGYYRLVLTQKIHLPFSFFRWIFWGKGMDLQDPEAERILKHENTHIQEGHTIDVLLVELISLIAWCSPLVYLYRQAFRNNHEYLADAAVIKEYQLKEYGHLLIKQSLSGPQIALVNHLIHSQLKNRILMMTKKRSSRLSQLRYFLALPLVALLLTAFSYDADYSIEEIPIFSENIQSNEVVKEDHEVEDVIFSPDLNHKTDIIENIERPKFEEIESLPFLDSKLNGQLSTLTKLGLDIDTTRPQPLYVLNGKVIDKSQATSILAESVESINVIKGDAAIKKYGDKGKNGVVELNCPKCQDNSFDYDEKLVESPELELDGKLILINDKPVDKSVYLKIDPKDIATINVWKSDFAIEKYGDEAKNGVIEITCPSCDIGKDKEGKINLKSDLPGDPLIVINGTIIDRKSEFAHIEPKQIKSINVLKGEAATLKYGEKAKKGVIEINCPSCKNEFVEKEVELKEKDLKISPKPLYYLNDFQVEDFQIKNIDPSKIKSISVIKDPVKLKKYGVKAENGVVLIECPKCDVEEIKKGDVKLNFENDFEFEIDPNIEIKTDFNIKLKADELIYDAPKNEPSNVEPINAKELDGKISNDFINRELELNNFSVTPNPTKGRLHLRFEAQPKNTQIKVLDSGGREIYNEQITNFNGLYDKYLDLNKASKGILLINIIQGEQIFNSKVILQ